MVAADALNGVQVKDTAESGALTINNQDALDALNSYVDLVHRNPDVKVSLRFLTTASLGRERDRADRVGDVTSYQLEVPRFCGMLSTTYHPRVGRRSLDHDLQTRLVDEKALRSSRRSGQIPNRTELT